ncbi:MAG: sigma-70 family RNA polymerase sigma factor [Polyangiaceae bacterium]|nr:sigma-70 family RNA polymerase sigma factor [Myxococcales bacterium]MCB9587814.1 sigma-70 family RNA polymerase sigma factor [Polyangiaceae bacterium]MCB9608763.1 sigma-70 family RNA polymerase sigma factor [Polyangiaceae bacterium]
MSEALTRAQAALPELQAEPACFARVLERVCQRKACEADALSDDGLAEVLLVAALMEHDPGAQSYFERAILDVVAPALAPMKLGSELGDDIRQQVAEKLLLPQDGVLLLERYAGDGRLRGLVKVMAVRSAISHTRKAKPERNVDLSDLQAGDIEWELERLKHGYRSAFRQAFAAALSGLSARDRNILRLHHFGGLSVEQVGEIYGVHRGTATRWIARIREDLLKATKAQLAGELGLTALDVESVMRLIQSQLDVSVERLLDTQSEHQSD